MSLISNFRNKKHYIIRVGDGDNFRNSKYPFWGVKRGRHDCIKTIIKKIIQDDVLWFMTSKKYGGKLIAFGEYKCYYDRKDEPLIKINTLSNKEQNWKGNDDWDIQIHYHNLYITDKQNIDACIQCGAIIMDYEKFIDKIKHNLFSEYKNFKHYAEPKKFIN